MTTLTASPDRDVPRRVLLAERDAARRERVLQEVRLELAATKLALQESELEVAEYLRQIGRLEDQFAAVFESLSWRLGAPVRRAAAVVNRLRGALGMPVPKPLPSPPPPKDAVSEPPTVPSLRERAILQRLQRQG